jgi:hypothetical protein
MCVATAVLLLLLLLVVREIDETLNTVDSLPTEIPSE